MDNCEKFKLDFIRKANLVHGDKYDYSLVSYKNKRSKVKIICKTHGEFEQLPENHLNGCGCPDCSAESRRLKSQSLFISEAGKVHNGKYDYSMVSYINNRTKVKIKCLECGLVFEQTPYNHLYKKCNCPNCSKNNSNTFEFIEKAVKIHNGKYDYSLVNYINSSTKVKIICKKHGVFEQIPNSHLSGHGCPKCSWEQEKSNVKKTTEEFISDARKIHGDKYDYSLVSYKNKKSKIKIICPIHGVFLQKPDNHLNGKGCAACSGNKKSSTDTWIEKAGKIHNGKYDYSLVSYTNNKSKVKIKCLECGLVFEQRACDHLNGTGCPECSKNKLTFSEFIEKARKIHNGKYDYSLVNYTNYNSKVKIVCLSCGNTFLQAPYSHLNGAGCPTCNRNKLNNDTFIEKAKKVHGDFYDYSIVSYTNYNSKIKIICKKHGEFLQSVKNHLSGSGCPICNESKGEKTIRNYLIENNIEFVSQKKFSDCKDKLPLPFDFYIPSKNLLIEFDGRQHYEIIEAFGGIEEFEKTRLHDSIKTDFASRNGFDLLRIKFDQDICEILTKAFEA